MPVTHVKLGTRVVFPTPYGVLLMRFSRARYVTLCQQSLVTAAVLAVGVSAAGVKTLDIVPQPGQAADLGAGLAGPQPREARAARIAEPPNAKVDAAPVTPKVREVKVT